MRMTRAGRGCAALAAIGALASGCSMLLSEPPPARPLRHPTECSDSRLPAYSDVYLAINAGALAVLTAAVAGAQEANAEKQIVPSWDPSPQPAISTAALLVIAGLSTAATYGLVQSARYGFRSAGDCEVAKLTFYRDLNINPYNGGPLQWSAPGEPAGR
jgi:hypothetical protein